MRAACQSACARTIKESEYDTIDARSLSLRWPIHHASSGGLPTHHSAERRLLAHVRAATHTVPSPAFAVEQWRGPLSINRRKQGAP